MNIVALETSVPTCLRCHGKFCSNYLLIISNSILITQQKNCERNDQHILLKESSDVKGCTIFRTRWSLVFVKSQSTMLPLMLRICVVGLCM